MKRRLLYIVLVMLCFVMPLEKTDVAKMQPIEAIGLLKEEKQTVMLTDTGDFGKGENALAALNDLIENSKRYVYLDTAKYLFFTEELEDEVEQIRSELKGSVYICIWSGKEDIKDAVDYVSIHKGLPRLIKWKKGESIPRFISDAIE